MPAFFPLCYVRVALIVFFLLFEGVTALFSQNKRDKVVNVFFT